MNHIYKVVWSKVRNCYVAVSEIAKGHGKKSPSEKWGGKKAALLAAIAITFGGFANVAMAADPAIVNDGKNILSTDAKFKDEIAEDPGTFSEGGGQSIAIGKDAYAFMQGGSKASLMRFGEKKVTGAIAVGEGAQALSQSIAIGNRVYTGDLGDVTLSKYNNALNGAGVGSVLLGSNSYTGGTLSTLMGDYSIMSTSYPSGNGAAYTQNAGAVSIGALNSIESATSKSSLSGIANSIVGLANRTQNANGALVYGAGNEITNSIAEASAPGSASSAKAAAVTLRESVKNSPGGAALAIGGGNKIDRSIRTQVMGVNNEVTGSLYHEDAQYDVIFHKFKISPEVNEYSSQYNMVDGYNNQVSNTNNAYVIGSNNTILGKTFSADTKDGILSKSDRTKAKESDNLVIIGDNHTMDKDVKNNIAIGSSDTALTTKVSNAVLLGHNADVQKDGGVAVGDGSVAATDKGAVGFDLKGEDHSSDTTGTWKSTAAAVSVGDATTKMTRQITNVAAGTEDTDAVNVAQLKRASSDAKTKYYSVNETYNGKVPVIDGFEAYTNADNKGAKEFAGLASGYMTYAGGIASTVTGSFSGIMNEAAAPGSNNFRGAAALSYGTFNVNDNSKDSQPFSGVANSIIGQANMTTDSNAVLIYGAGNSVTNSYRAIDLQKADAIMKNLKDPEALKDALKDAVPTSGGQVMVMGGGNTVTSAYMTQVVGVGNTVTGNDKEKEYAEGTSTQLNYVDGFFNMVEKGKNDYVIGSHNTLTGSSVDTNKSNLVLGDNHKLTDKKNNVILGSADDKDKVTDASDAVILGHNANASVDGGVALGSGSVAETGAGIAGYDPLTKANSTPKDKAWTSSWAAVSVGDSTHTRQITGVAAGTALTDAVNVAQLQSVMNMPVNIYNGGKMASNSYAAGTKLSNNWNLSNLQFDFGDGLKAQEVGDDGDKRVLVTLDKNALKGDPDFKGDKGDTGPQGPAGKDGKDGINGKDGAVGPQGPAGKDGINGKDGKDGKDGINGKDGKDGKDGGVGTVVGDDTNITAVNTETDATKPANYKVSLNKEITVAKVTAGDTTVSSDGVSIAGGPSMTTNGIDAAGKKITHVAAGTEATDAVNYGQLKDVESKVDSNSQAITNINSHVNRLDNRINKVGAGAAALAGLHPLDFDPSDKWNFAVGYGNYRNANSVAVGAFYRPNEDTMVSVGTNFGNGENMVNAGVSFKLGQGSSYAGVSKAELAEENQKLKANDAAQDQKIQNQEKEIQELKKALEELKSHIK
ncbi:ESPR-type extended signal peptide-containing protein [uncultured Dialister sp.]|uniref:ESPR-type extended signal peptide-containing protein n=1 Tax=uncultured Dialister sp. TaxID=278064 RepID=UPI0026DC7DCB|nr:ESPR-type extended signal peptide-containing protein [uncultured Dialister sp.]